MPFVINGIGTWYYGKRRMHTLPGTCEFCRRQTALSSYDTTLYFVVVFIPLIPLQHKRVQRQCAECRRHRVLSLKAWEQAKDRDAAGVLELLRANPEDRGAILRALQFAVGYQDEPLFDKIADTFAAERADDMAIQAQLGYGYAFFARWDRAEAAYRAALALDDTDALREQLALALLKLERPDDARPYLRHLLDNPKKESAGMIYLLIQCYQAEGRHEEALELMDRRDQAFPEWAKEKAYQQQRKVSMRYRHSDKKIRPTVLAQSKAGYRAGNWTASVPRWVGLFVLLAALGLYLGSAVWIGQARKVYLVNGTDKPYAVVVQGVPHTLAPHSATPIHVAEGNVQVSFSDAGLALEPVQARIETSFWSRPFAGHTFVINPDQSAVVLEEAAYYAAANPSPPPRPTVHFGEAFYSLGSVDYEYEPFPQSIQVDGNAELKKTRIGLAPYVTPEVLQVLVQDLEQPRGVQFCERLLRLDPNRAGLLYWLSTQIAPDEFIAFVETRLDERPLLVEWHRAYQSEMEKAHPETDLRPRYRKLVADTGGSADAVYLLGRADPDVDEAEKLYRQAASAEPPSGYACYSLGYRAMSEARFADACHWLEKAMRLLADKSMAQQLYDEALLANGDFNPLLDALKAKLHLPGRGTAARLGIMRVHAIRGDKAAARDALEQAVQLYPPPDRAEAQNTYELWLCCWLGDVDGYLQSAGDKPLFEAAFLRGQFQRAADLVNANDAEAVTHHGLLYLQAARSSDKQAADVQWQALLADLKKEGRDERLLADYLSGQKPLVAPGPERLPIEAGKKRVLLAVLAQRHPDRAGELLTTAKKLDYQHDAISLCLSKLSQRP